MCIIDPYRRSEGGGRPGFTRSGNPSAAKKASRATSAVGVRMFHVKHLGGSCPQARHTPTLGNPRRPRANTAPSYPHDTLAPTRHPRTYAMPRREWRPRAESGASRPRGPLSLTRIPRACAIFSPLPAAALRPHGPFALAWLPRAYVAFSRGPSRRACVFAAYSSLLIYKWRTRPKRKKGASLCEAPFPIMLFGK